VEVYKGVFLMLASHNLWIIDANFMCFFSYTPIDRVKHYFKNKTTQEGTDYAFDVMNQPFPVKWLTNQNSLNVAVEGESLYVLGTVLEKLYFLEYQFILESGMLKLKTYQPLFTQTEPIYSIKEESLSERREFSFNIYSENFEAFKNSKWIYHGSIFLEVLNLQSISCKGYIQINLQTEPVLASVKDIIEEKRKSGQQWNKQQTAMLLYNISSIFGDINKQGISHKHFSLSNLWIT
jgi:hypothetical protein